MFFKLKVNFLSRLWLCPPRSCRTSFPQLSRPLCSDEKSQIKDEVLSRVQVVDDLKASAKIVDDLVERGQPVGVDMEGLNAGQVGMVQVKAPDNKIYIFRPTIHPRIWSQGKLKNLFEAHQVLKVFHAATMDLIATNRNGVKLWSLYDTALAEKIINYQRHGTSTTAETLSFQSMCAKYGVFVNPVKDNYSGRKWNTIAWHNQVTTIKQLFSFELLLIPASVRT